MSPALPFQSCLTSFVLASIHNVIGPSQSLTEWDTKLQIVRRSYLLFFGLWLLFSMYKLCALQDLGKIHNTLLVSFWGAFPVKPHALRGPAIKVVLWWLYISWQLKSWLCEKHLSHFGALLLTPEASCRSCRISQRSRPATVNRSVWEWGQAGSYAFWHHGKDAYEDAIVRETNQWARYPQGRGLSNSSKHSHMYSSTLILYRGIIKADEGHKSSSLSTSSHAVAYLKTLKEYQHRVYRPRIEDTTTIPRF